MAEDNDGDVYVNWQPRAFAFAMAAMAAGILALTLLALWLRGERKGALLWKAALSLAVSMGVLNGVSFLINNAMTASVSGNYGRTQILSPNLPIPGVW